MPEARQGFLLNHLIDEMLPAHEAGTRYSNSDPVTGQAAWYDLKVRIEPAEAAAVTEPQFPVLALPPGMAERPRILRYGAGFRKPRGG